MEVDLKEEKPEEQKQSEEEPKQIKLNKKQTPKPVSKPSTTRNLKK